MDAKIAFIKKKILSNLQREWKIEEIAQAVNVSQPHLQKLFKFNTETSPIQFIKQMRLERACELLETTFMRVQQIGFSVGMTDQSYFVREFKKKYGVTPSEYRLKFRENIEVEENKSQ